ncbi:hypothetical protein Cylst_1518 [Cylindrospermum stagnale PCC 7417]|uniref:Uncharacterized protein n=1 Tax=Cylindrospermum stagnale PCC 7417 TaxID=56107 RepID=K9WW99_9NOST|nr:hypothetical protein Cylst_1518 [Cylindrospermum stagnale PCC 7417]
MIISNKFNLFSRIRQQIMPFIYRKDLRKLAIFYGTDKWNSHWYAQHYNVHFAPLSVF